MENAVLEGVVAVIERGERLLAIRRAAGILAGGFWCLPGGVHEEVGLQVQPVREIWQWLRPDGRLRLYWWLARLTDAVAEPMPAFSEVAEVRWVSRAEFRCLEPILESNTAFLDFYQQLQQSAADAAYLPRQSNSL